jgi:hypothetical protein
MSMSYVSAWLTVSFSTNTALSRREETKMRGNILITVALAMLATMAASAQTINVKATVPFSFIVGRSTLSAGEYSLKTMSNGQVLALSNRDAKITELVLSNSCESLTASKTKLVFHRYGDRYFLSQIWTEGNNRGHEIPISQREKETARNSSMQQVVLVAEKH